MAHDEKWPYCDDLKGVCFTYRMAQFMGADLLDDMMVFIWNAQEGSRLTLHKNRNEFTLQITGPVKRAAKQPLELSSARKLQAALYTSKG